MKNRGSGSRGRGRNQGGGGGKQGYDGKGRGGKGHDESRGRRDGRAQPEKRGGARPADRGRDRDRPADRPAHRAGDRSHDRDGSRRHGDFAPRRGDRSPSDPPRAGRASLWGTHAVRAAWLNPARTIRALHITAEAKEDFAATIAEAEERGLDRPAPTIADRRQIDRMTGPGAVHQGIAIDAAPLEDVFIRDLISIAAGRERAIIVMLDQVTDPHNVGAIMRSASAFGAVGIVMQKRHAPELDGVLVKTASGAAEHIPVAYETNLSRTLEELKEENFIALALDERGDISLEEMPACERVVIVMGAEGPGIRRLVKEHCDRLVRLPTGGPVGVLNVSNAAAVALYAVATAR